MKTGMPTHSYGTRMMALFAVAFGLLTLWEGGRTLAGDAQAVAAAGNYVPFVLWFNFLAGFAYVIAGAGLWWQMKWAAALSVVIAGATALAFAAFGAQLALGAAFEQRTVIAMSLRLLAWTVIAVIAWRWLHGPAQKRTQSGSIIAR